MTVNELLDAPLPEGVLPDNVFAAEEPALSTVQAFSTEQFLAGVSGPFPFAQLTLPIGIAVDTNGNVYVSAENFGPVMAVFDANANLLGTLQLAPLISPVDAFGTLHFEIDEESGLLYSLSPNGLIQAFDSSQGGFVPLLSLQNLNISSDAVFDIAQGTVTNFTGTIQTQFANYGDFDIFNGDGFTDFYASGLSNGFPFVLRLRVTQQQGLVDARVLASSFATAAPNQGRPPGIAVNDQGIVLTTLPIPNNPATGNFNVPVAFGINYEPTQNSGVVPFIVDTTDIASTGMTTDPAGNFYIATSAVGSSLGGLNGAGAVVVLSAALDQYLGVLPVGNDQVTFASNDVAVSPSGDRLYITYNESLFGSISGNSGVLVYGLPIDITGQSPAVLAQSLQSDSLLSDEFGITAQSSASSETITNGESEANVGFDELWLDAATGSSFSNSPLSTEEQITLFPMQAAASENTLLAVVDSSPG